MKFPVATAVQENSALRPSLRLTQLTFEVGEMTKSSEKNNDHSFFELIALQEFRMFLLSPRQVFLVGIIKNFSALLCKIESLYHLYKTLDD